MPRIEPFTLLRPRSTTEAVALKGQHPAARWLAGGTDLLVNMRRGIAEPEVVIDLTGANDLTTLEQTPDGGLRVGAAVTLERLLASPALAGRQALAEAAAAVAGTSHRVMATVGGNLCLDTRCLYYNQSAWWRAANDYCLKYRGTVCHVAPKGQRCYAAYSGDLAPALMVLGATIEVTSPQGTQHLPLGALFHDDGAAHLTLGADQLLSAVLLPPRPEGSLASGYEKLRVRGAIDFPLAGVAAALELDDQRRVTALAIALTGVHTHPLHLPIPDSVRGKPLLEDTIEDLARLATRRIQPMRSTLDGSHHRRSAAGRLTARLLRRLL